MKSLLMVKTDFSDFVKNRTSAIKKYVLVKNPPNCMPYFDYLQTLMSIKILQIL